ncbi:MAG: sensor histidine kinase [Oscillospiraceae bacterium]|nr:sensor histidine kinase [Oscillospiraceae bacterium]MDD4368836.1 sensor histidine kinase [Oscillospiraceae bacterium]
MTRLIKSSPQSGPAKQYGLFIRRYLRQHRRLLGFGLGCSGIFIVLFILYDLPLAAVLYPLLLSAVAGSMLLLWDIRQSWRRHQSLARLQPDLSTDLSELPAPLSPAEADYQAALIWLQRQQRQREAGQQQQYQDMLDYYSIWAHQIKTPIAAMQLKLQQQDSAAARALQADLLHIEQYVEMVLVYIRLDSSDSDYVFHYCQLDRIIRRVLRHLAGDFIRRGLRLDYQPLQRRLLTDEKWLAFVIEQLLTNALKYTRTGSISLYWEEPATLCIKDSGIGILPEDLPRIFEKGYTGRNGRQTERASGIGLYLCRRICHNLGYQLEARSEAGKGSTFCIHMSRQTGRLE